MLLLLQEPPPPPLPGQTPPCTHGWSSSHVLCLLTAPSPITHVWEAQQHHPPVLFIAQPSSLLQARHSFPGISCARPRLFQDCWKGWHLSQGISSCQSRSAMAQLPHHVDRLIRDAAPQNALLGVRCVRKELPFPGSRKQRRGCFLLP